MTPMKFIPALLLAVASLFVAANDAVAQDVVTYYHTDATGSPIAATDANGNLLWREDYSPYGERLTQDNSPRTNRMWFTGHHQDEDSGLTYAGARHYDPMIGRFLGVDPAAVDPGNPFSVNRYAYGNDNPYRYVDPNGAETGSAYRYIYLADGGLKTPPPRSPEDKLGPAIGVGLGVMLAPVAAVGAGEAYIAYMAAPEATALFAEGILLGDAAGPSGLLATAAVAKGAKEIIASNGTRITGFVRHGIDRVIGDGASRAGTKPQAILDALKNPTKLVEGIDKKGRPFEVFTGENARVVVNPGTGKVVSVNPKSRAGAH